MESDEIICSNCEKQINDSDDFCPFCGQIFIQNVTCYTHENKEAEGVCVICNYAFCSECGLTANNHYFCKGHSNYETHESLAVIGESKDLFEVEGIKSNLIESGLHPYIYTEQTGKIHPTALDTRTLLMPDALYPGDKLKLLVPFQEVLQAEDLISKLDIENEE
jgi:hypothetical protein